MRVGILFVFTFAVTQDWSYIITAGKRYIDSDRNIVIARKYNLSFVKYKKIFFFSMWDSRGDRNTCTFHTLFAVGRYSGPFDTVTNTIIIYHSWYVK